MLSYDCRGTVALFPASRSLFRTDPAACRGMVADAGLDAQGSSATPTNQHAMTHNLGGNAIKGALIGALLSSGCSWFGIGGPEERLLTVLDHKAECFSPFPLPCLLTPGAVEGQRQSLFPYPEGLEYEWGFVYTIVVEESTIANPPQDASSRRSVLKRVVNKSRVPEGTEFDISLSGEGAVPVLTAPGIYSFLGDGLFSCTNAGECEALVETLEQQRPVLVRLAHPASAQEPLRVVRWQVCTPLSGGHSSCAPQ